MSPVMSSSSDGGACALKRGGLGVGDDGWKYACSYRDVASLARMIPLTPLLRGSRRGLAHSFPIRRYFVSQPRYRTVEDRLQTHVEKFSRPRAGVDYPELISVTQV